MAERIWRIVYTRAYRDEQFFKENMPREYRSLEELLRAEHPGVLLLSGVFHSFDKRDLENAARAIPWYLHRLVKFPWVFLYLREGLSRRFVLKQPDFWAARALHLILRGDLGGEVWEVSSSEMEKLLSMFRSLIMVSLVYDAGRGGGYEWH